MRKLFSVLFLMLFLPAFGPNARAGYVTVRRTGQEFRRFYFGSMRSDIRIRHRDLRDGGWECRAYRTDHHIIVACGHADADTVVSVRDHCRDGLPQALYFNVDGATVAIATYCGTP